MRAVKGDLEVLSKLNKGQKKILSEYLQILQRDYKEQIVSVILFGSITRGDSNLESDIDILVVTANGDQKLKDEISMACFDLK